MADIFTNSSFKLLGITDEVTACDCCGKPNLARTVAMEKEDGEIVHYGTTCAARALTGRRCRKTGELIWGRALMIQNCKDVLPAVLAAINAGENPKKAVNPRFHVFCGRYSDTGNKMPLSIYFDGWSIPGVQIPANAY
jgi:hypothetical protein